jgi:hypothetical protein
MVHEPSLHCTEVLELALQQRGVLVRLTGDKKASRVLETL